MKFATGDRAWGQCRRCGDQFPYTEMVSDGQIPGLRVCPPCRDEKHPAEKPFKADDAVALRHPATDLDDDSPGDSGQSLVTALGFTNRFGGGT